MAPLSVSGCTERVRSKAQLHEVAHKLVFGDSFCLQEERKLVLRGGVSGSLPRNDFFNHPLRPVVGGRSWSLVECLRALSRPHGSDVQDFSI